MISIFSFTYHFFYCFETHKIALPFQARRSRIVYYWSISYKTVPNIVKDSRGTSLLAVDEVEHVQRQRIVSAIQHPNQRQHSCLMMDKDDSWIYYREDVVEKLIWMQSWTMLKVCAMLLTLSLVNRGKCTSVSYQRCLEPLYFSLHLS